jgi:hypothetical protein
MSEESRPYVVRQGESLYTIARAHGLEPDAIWRDGKNTEVARTRDPDILAPGDLLYLPPRPAPSLRVAPQTSNAFTAKVPAVVVAVAFQDENGPLRGERYVVTGLGEPVEGALDGRGGLALPVPVSVATFVVEFPERRIAHSVWVRHLDPVSEPSGLRARLVHLGYGPMGQDSADPYTFVSDEAERRAIAAFQRAVGLTVTGVADEKTRAKLTEMHGC